MQRYYSSLLFFFFCTLTLPIDTHTVSIQANVGKMRTVHMHLSVSSPRS